MLTRYQTFKILIRAFYSISIILATKSTLAHSILPLYLTETIKQFFAYMTSIVVNQAIFEADGSTQVHLLPCKIKHDGPTRVSTFFDVTNVSHLPGRLPGEHMAFFRGRELRGFRVEIPDDMIAAQCATRVAALVQPGLTGTHELALSQLPPSLRNLDDSMEEAALDTTADSTGVQPGAETKSRSSGDDRSAGGGGSGDNEDDLDAAFSDDDSEAEHNARFCKTGGEHGAASRASASAGSGQNTAGSGAAHSAAAPTKELRLEAVRRVGTAMQWKLEDAPSADDPLAKAIAWMRISHAVSNAMQCNAMQCNAMQCNAPASLRTH